LVLIGARSEARGQQLEHHLTENGRVAVLGVHILSDPLLRALATSPTSALVIDTQLADTNALDLLYRVMMRRPCAAIALAGPASGDFAAEAIRAGASNCVDWTATPDATRALAD